MLHTLVSVRRLLEAIKAISFGHARVHNGLTLADATPQAGCAILIRDSKALILKRGPTAPWRPNTWNLPGGIVDEGETPRQCAERELEEEAGIKAKLDPTPTYQHDDDGWKISYFIARDPSGTTPKLDYESSDYTFVNISDIDKYAWAIPQIGDAVRHALGVAAHNYGHGAYDPYATGSIRPLRVSATESLGHLSNLRKLSGLRQVLAYCQSNFSRLGAGSSRVVFDFDNGRVIKVAKNHKGSAQNRVEIDTSNLYDRVVAKVIEYDESDDNAWIVSEKARRATASDWPILAGVSWKLAKEFLAAEGARHQNRPYRKQPDELYENELLGSVVSLMADYNMPVGDMLRPSSWGVVNHNGKDVLVLVDSGLTNDVFQEHYR